jgi:hypothetical protein
VAAEVDLLWKWLALPSVTVVAGAISPTTRTMPRLERLAG